MVRIRIFGTGRVLMTSDETGEVMDEFEIPLEEIPRAMQIVTDKMEEIKVREYKENK